MHIPIFVYCGYIERNKINLIIGWVNTNKYYIEKIWYIIRGLYYKLLPFLAKFSQSWTFPIKLWIDIVRVEW